MKKTAIAKLIVNNLTDFTVGSVTYNIINNNVSPSSNAAVNVLVGVAKVVTSLAVTGVVQEHVQPYTDKVIDDMAESFQSLKQPQK